MSISSKAITNKQTDTMIIEKRNLHKKIMRFLSRKGARNIMFIIKLFKLGDGRAVGHLNYKVASLLKLIVHQLHFLPQLFLHPKYS